MPLLRPINLPTPLILQSFTSVGLALYLALTRRPPYTNTANGYSLFVPSNPSPRTADTISFLGVVVTGLEVTYLVSSYMPIEENQFVAASIPVRIGLSVLMGSICVVYRNSMSKSGFWELGTLAVLDGGRGDWAGVLAGEVGWDG